MISNRYNKGFSKSLVLRDNLKDWVFWGILVAVAVALKTAAYGQDLDSKPANETERREKLHAIRMKQIPLLEQFLTKYKGSPKAAEQLFRLAEAHYESGKYFDAMGNKAEGASHNHKAVEILEGMRRDYPDSPRLDEALFVLANSYIEAGEMPKAGAVLSEVAEKYPNSPVLKQASLLLGDFYFDKQQFAKAETYYRTAAEEPKTQSYVYYKMAWVSMNMGQPSRALQSFEKVLALRGQPGSDYSKDAAREIVFPALEVYKTSGIVAYLEKTLADPELTKLSLNTLAKGLMQKSDFTAASDIYAILGERYPQDPLNEEWVSAELKAEESLGRTTKIGTLVARLSGSGAASPKVQAQVYNSAKKFHAEAQKASEGPEKSRLYEVAIGYYKAFLQGDAVSQQAAQVHFYLGEALFAKNQFAEARAEYQTSAKTQSDVQSKAAWNWFLTAEKMADGFQYQGKTLQASTANDEEYLRAAREIQEIPGISLEQKRKASYQSARLLYQLNDLDRALPVFQLLAERFAGTQEGKLSAQLVLDIYNLRKDFKNVAQYARSYQAQADSGTKAELSQLEQKAMLKSIQEDEEASKNQSGDAKFDAIQSVAQKYLDFAKSYPQSALVDAALWSSVQNFAIVAAERGSRGDEKVAAFKNSFELLTSKYAHSSFTPKAVTLMGKFLSQRRASAKELQDYLKFRDAWETQMRSEPKDQRGLMAMMVFKMSNEHQKKLMVKEFASLPKTDDNKEPLAYVELEKVKVLRDKLDAISLSNLKTLKKNTQQRMELLDRLQADVTTLVKMGVAIPALDALKVLGDGYTKMGAAMRAAPIPKALVGDQLQQYKEIVAGAAQDLEAKGSEAYRLAEEKSKEIDLSAI